MQPRERLAAVLSEIGAIETAKGVTDKEFCTSAVSIFCRNALSDSNIKDALYDVDEADYAIVGIFVIVTSDIFSRPFDLEFERVALDAISSVIEFNNASVMASGYAEAVKIFNDPSSQKYLQALGARVIRLVSTLQYDHYHELIPLLEIGHQHLAEQGGR